MWKEIGASNPYLQTFNRYVGDFKDGCGMAAAPSSTPRGLLRGDWRNNLKQGDGTFVYEDGTVYIGSFEQTGCRAAGAVARLGSRSRWTFPTSSAATPSQRPTRTCATAS